MPEYVRQHHNLATTGKLGQKARPGTVPKGGSTVKNDSGPSGASDSRRGSYKVPKHRRGK